MAWVASKPLPSGRYRAGYVDRNNDRKTFVGTTKKSDTLKAAQQYEVEEREIRIKLRAAPGPEELYANKPIAALVEEHLNWGRAQGGKRGAPWSESHSRMREMYMNWWTKKLGLKVLGDLCGNDILGAAQKAVQNHVRGAGRCGKTCGSYRDALVAFCKWLVKRKYMSSNPLESWSEYDKTPLMKRRALTLEEIGALLKAAPKHRRLVYEVALSTGLRANELRSLRVGNLDTRAGGLRLEGTWTKNRREDFQPLPQHLVERLVQESSGKAATAPLLKGINTHPARTFRRDCDKAGIAADAFGGRADFHALRHTAITLAGECGATAKEMQTFARHSDPRLTMNTYAHVRQNRRSELANRLGQVIDFAKKDAIISDPRTQDVHAQRAQSVHAKAVGAEELSRNLLAGAAINNASETKGTQFESSSPHQI